MRILVGTSGWQYPAWRGHFYPEGLATEQMLSYYAERFPVVEVNSTFYRMPRESVLRGWSDRVPSGFRFVLKASRRITHDGRLGEEAFQPLDRLVEVARSLGGHLGPFLFQTPPFLRKDLPRLFAFVRRLPGGTRAAFEFRHPSWLDEEVLELLEAHGVALCAAETGEGETPLHATAPYGYLRLRKETYATGELERWAERIRAQPWDEAYVFFKHEERGTGPRLAARFAELFRADSSHPVQS